MNYYILFISFTNLFSMIAYLNKQTVPLLLNFKISFNINTLFNVLIFFIPIIFINFYKLFDKVIIGLLLPVSELSYYEISNRILLIPTTLLLTLVSTLYPTISKKYVSSKVLDFESNLILKSISFILFLSIGFILGINLLSGTFVEIYLDNSYFPVGELLIIGSISILIVLFNSILKSLVYFPSGNEKYYINGTIISGSFSLILLFFLTNYFGLRGAVLSVILAELIQLVYLLLKLKNVKNFQFKFDKYLKIIFKLLFSAINTFILIKILDISFASVLLQFTVISTLGLIIYSLFSWILFKFFT